MEVYKVVELNLDYEPSIRGTFMSSRTSIFSFLEPEIDKNGSILFYSINKVTKPHFGFLFCFKDLENAKLFRKIYGGIILFGKGISVNKKIPIFYTMCDDFKRMKKGWKNSCLTIKDYKDLPTGTTFMRTFKPLRIVG
jgi:hypothetical protein